MTWKDRFVGRNGREIGLKRIHESQHIREAVIVNAVDGFFSDFRDVLQVDAAAGFELSAHDVLENGLVLFEVVLVEAGWPASIS